LGLQIVRCQPWPIRLIQQLAVHNIAEYDDHCAEVIAIFIPEVRVDL
jgi:hypothetical protein